MGQTCLLSAVEDERKIFNVILMCIATVNMITPRVIFAEPYDTQQHWFTCVSHMSTANFTKKPLTVFPNFPFVPCHLPVGQCILTSAALERAGVAPPIHQCCLSYMPLESPEIHISIRVFHRVEGCYLLFFKESQSITLRPPSQVRDRKCQGLLSTQQISTVDQ